MTHDTLGQQGYGQPVDWDADVFYPERQSVIDRGGIWRAVAPNINSQPVSGNTDWELVAGTPYVDVTLDPVALTTLPFNDGSGSGPGLVVIPGSAGHLTLVTMVMTSVSDGDAWSNDANLNISWQDQASLQPPIPGPSSPTFTFKLTLNADLTSTQRFQSAVPLGNVAEPISNFGTDFIGSPVVIWTVSNLGTTGTRSGFIRIYYTLNPASPAALTFSSFFAISGVNTGTKTFTVSPDPTGLTGAVTVVGSPLNDGAYTVASVTATEILVNEAIPDGTAGGWVKQ